MANSRNHHHNQRLLLANQTPLTPTAPTSTLVSQNPSTSSAALIKPHHHSANVGHHNGAGAQGKPNYRNHQRRQSVARLLPDISKLRLLSWLVEASSELINCNIAIMDGVYAKLNRSQESLLFWSNSNNTNKPPPTPQSQPVANNIVISQQRKKQQLKQHQPRNHHSLPLTNFDASSLAPVPLSSFMGPLVGASECDTTATTTTTRTTQQTAGNENFSDSNQSDDDDNSSAASSTTSSGIQGSLSSYSSASSSSSSSSAASSSSSSSTSGELAAVNLNGLAAEADGRQFVSSAEQLSEKIRRTLMEHNYLQNLLVNIIRQHDKQRNQLNHQRSRQMSLEIGQIGSGLNRSQRQQRIDLADIADALDDGCLCLCHSEKQKHCDKAQTRDIKSGSPPTKAGRSSTLPAASTKQQQQQNVFNINVAGNNQVPSRKVRRSKKLRPSANGAGSNELSNRRELINLLADKLCENCFETHFWLHGNDSDDLLTTMQPQSSKQDSCSSDPLNGFISKRNATFIKLVQQEVRSTISKSIELIDLIRKEIKSPESIKQKQLMRCFSTSIQLLTSVGNYVVPAQDISSFIPEIGQHQTTLFSLPSSDFDHLLLNPSFMNQTNQQQQQQLQQSANSNYHLAAAPEIPMRRKSNHQRQQQQQRNQPEQQAPSLTNEVFSKDSSDPVAPITCSLKTTDQATGLQHQQTSRLRLSEGNVDSSSGASSNNSSASSSIARGTVQQSSLTRAQTSSAILDGKTSHDLSYEAIASLSRQQTEDDMIFQSRPKFWQSSKFNFIKKLLHVKEQRLLRQQSKDRRIYNNKVQNKFRLVMMDLIHFNKSQQLLTTENGVNSLLTSMRNVLEFGLYLTLKLY